MKDKREMFIQTIAASTRMRRAPLSRGVAAAVAAIVLGSALPASAQQTEIDALRQQIQALQDRLDKMEADTTKAASAAAKTPATTAKFPVTVSGLGQVHFLGFQGQDRTLARQADTFRLRRAEIRLTAALSPRITGTIMFDPAKGISQNSAGIINPSSNILQELIVQYLLSKSARSSHYIDIGQYKIPVGYEGDLVSASAIPTVERALMFSQRDPFGGGFGDIRDTGAQLRGTFGELEYRLGIFNGLGERQNQLAASDNKAVLARLVYRPQGIEGLQLGISGGRGNTGNPPAAGNRAKRSLFNLFAVYKKNKLTLQSEFLNGNSSVNPSTVTRARDIQSYYALVGYLFNPKLEGVLRYDSFDFDRDLGGTTARDITLGLNYYIRGNNAKIQANIVRRQGGNGITGGTGGNGFSSGTINNFQQDRTELRTNFQVAF